MAYVEGRMEDYIISAIRNNKQVFYFINCEWDLKRHRQYLIDALYISLKQMYNKMYYGRFTMQQIEDAIRYLTIN